MRRMLLLLLLVSCLPLSLWSAKKAENSNTLAVLPFEGEKEFKKSELETLSELFLTYMIRTEVFTITERSRIDAILQEQAFSLSDFTQDTDLVKIGELLAAQSVVVGRLNRVGDQLNLTVRRIDVSTGVSDRAQSIQGPTIERISAQLDRLARSIAENVDVSRIIDRRNKWSIDTDATLVVMKSQFYAAGASVGVRMQVNNRISASVVGGAMMKAKGGLYPQGGVKLTVYPTNNLGITLQIGLFPGIGASYKDIEVTFAPMWLFGYDGFAASLGYSFGL